jgi:hypothetical protein
MPMISDGTYAAGTGWTARAAIGAPLEANVHRIYS